MPACKPLCIDLFCGLGGWAEGFLAEGYDVIGFDVERHDYGTGGYPAQLVLQDVLTLDGKQFRDATVIVASPPCQAYSYMAMPWTRAKAMAAEIRQSAIKWAELNRLFIACFRIAAEAGVPLIVENVCGAQPWVGPARWHYGSFYLWGDVPALMPITAGRLRYPASAAPRQWSERDIVRLNDGSQSHAFHQKRDDGVKASGLNWSDRTMHGQDFTRLAGGVKAGTRLHDGKWSHSFADEIKNNGNGTWFYEYRGVKQDLPSGDAYWSDPTAISRRSSSHSHARKAASAQIAKIPFPLARHIARCFK